MIDRGGFRISDDFLRITGTLDAIEFARWLSNQRPEIFAWEAGNPSSRYAASLRAEGGVFLAYGRKNRDGLDAPQSDTRDSSEFCLEIPSSKADGLLDLLRTHPRQAEMQCTRRDIAVTWLPCQPAHVYSLVRDVFRGTLRRAPHRIGPDRQYWRGVSLQTHPQQAGVPRFAILYDKHAQSPDEYPDDGTVRLEFRWQPEKKQQKRACFEASMDALLDSWSLARCLVEVLTLEPRKKSFAWLPDTPERDFEKKVAALLHSYGPTIYRGVLARGRDFLGELVVAAALLESRKLGDSVGESLFCKPENQADPVSARSLEQPA